MGLGTSGTGQPRIYELCLLANSKFEFRPLTALIGIVHARAERIYDIAVRRTLFTRALSFHHLPSVYATDRSLLASRRVDKIGIFAGTAPQVPGRYATRKFRSTVHGTVYEESVPARAQWVLGGYGIRRGNERSISTNVRIVGWAAR